MADDICQRLLRNAEACRLDSGQEALLELDVDLESESRPLSLTLDVPAEGRGQPEVVKHRWT